MAAADPTGESSAGGASTDTGSTEPTSSETGAGETSSAEPSSAETSSAETSTAGPSSAAGSDNESTIESQTDSAAGDPDVVTNSDATDSAAPAEDALPVTGDQDGDPDVVDSQQADAGAAVPEIATPDPDPEDPPTSAAPAGSHAEADRSGENTGPTAATGTADTDPMPNVTEDDVSAADPPTSASDAEVSARIASSDASVPVPSPGRPAVTPRSASVSTGLAGIVSKFLSLLGIGPSAAGGGVPLPRFEFVTAVFGAIRREFDRIFANDGPTAAWTLSGQSEPGTVDGAASSDVAAAESNSPVARAFAALATPAAATTGTIYHVTTSGSDIVGFDPAADKLDLGDVSVHNFIVVDTTDGVGFRNPWSGETAIVAGVSLGQLTVNSFTPIINDHLRQDLSGALAWEQGVSAQPNTVYARSHEVGQIDRATFDAATDVVDFRYFGTREQLYMADTPEGVVISNAGTGQALILQGTTTSRLTARNFVFHSAQVREDRLHLQLGIGTVPDSQIRPQGVPIAGTDNWPTGAGSGTPPTGETGATTTISWQYGAHTAIDFDPAKDKLDFGWFKATEFDVTERSGSTHIAIVGNNQSYLLTGVAVGELTTGNIVALDDGARTKWQSLIYNAVPPAASPSLSVSDGSVSEGNANTAPLAFAVRLSQASSESVTVSYSTSNGTATAAGQDYTPTVGTLAFAPGETAKTVQVAVTGDTLVELDEQFTLTLSSPTNATIADGTGMGTIRNDDVDAAPATPPAVSIADLSVTEGNGEHSHFMFVATLNKASSDPVTARYATSNGTAVAGSDYAATSGTITFAPGVTSQQVHVDVVGDAAAEPSETFTVTLSNPTGATIGDGTATGSIVDDDGAPVPVLPTVSIADASVVEANSGTKNLAFVVTLDKASTTPVSVAYATGSGTATSGSDFRSKSGTVTFAAGVLSQQIQVAITGDTAVEASETFTVTLSNPKGITVVDGSAIGTITNDDVAPVLPTVSITDATIVEANSGTKNLAFVVTLDKASTTPVSITYATGSGTATTGSDFRAKSGTVRFAAGVVSQQIVIAVKGDTAVEGNETFTLTLSNPKGATIADGSAIGIITNDDGAPVPVLPKVSIADAAVAEADSGIKNVAFAVTLDKAATAPVSVGYATGSGTATSGTDFSATAGTVTFAPGVTTQQIQIGISGDTAVEGNETFTLTLSNPNGMTIADGSATGTITNDDVATPAPGNSSASFVVSDDWGSGFTAAVTVTAGTSGLDGWTVEFDTPAQISTIWNAEIVSRVGNHYTVRNVSYNPTVAAGQMAGFGFQASPGGASATATNFVVNGQPGPVQPPTITVADATVNESNSGTTQMTFLVTLSKASGAPVTVAYATSNGTATAGADFTATSGTLTFAPGLLSQQVQVSIAGDTAVEANETFTLTLANPSGATVADGSAIGTITNDDVAIPGTLSLSISDASVTEGAPGTGVAPGWFRTSGNQIVDSAGNPVQIAGINWFGLESDISVPHGLWTRNYKEMMNQMVALDFNTIRLPYSSEMLHTTAAPSGIDFNKNPDLAGLSSLQIMDKIIGYAGEIGMRVILDHHRSSKGAGPNGNGLWYEGSYTEAAWIDDWKMLAQRYAADPTVIGADLHNEPHNGTWGGGGATDWAAAAERAGNAVLGVNSNWLVFVEGVETHKGQNYWWGGNLMGVKDRPIVLTVPNRVVYSPHDYPNSVYNQPWFQTANFGAALPDKFEQMWGYIYEQNIAPIYLGEFGTKLTDPKDVVWYEAITSYLSGDFDNNGTIDIAAGTQDMSWTFWSWNPNSSDTGGILANDWNTVNANKMAYLESIKFDFDEGSPGVLAQFVVSLAAPSNQTVTVRYATSNGTATGGSDYANTSGTLTFLPGETSKSISVVVFGDTVLEGNESFVVMLSSPSGATIADATGAGSIADRTVV